MEVENVLSESIDLSQHKEALLKQFRCQNSGNCCRAEGYVYVTDSDIAKMSRRLGLSESEFLDRHVRRHKGWRVIAAPNFQTQCLLDEESHCQVYAERPLACRTYPNWPEIWSSHDAVLSESRSCPGLKKAILSCFGSISNV